MNADQEPERRTIVYQSLSIHTDRPEVGPCLGRRMFHPDQYENDPEKRKTYELLTQAINEARDRGDIELLETIAKDPQAFILKQGWASVSLDGSRDLKELRSLYEYLQARILELIETLGELRASPDYELFLFAEKDVGVIDQSRSN